MFPFSVNIDRSHVHFRNYYLPGHLAHCYGLEFLQSFMCFVVFCGLNAKQLPFSIKLATSLAQRDPRAEA